MFTSVFSVLNNMLILKPVVSVCPIICTILLHIAAIFCVFILIVHPKMKILSSFTHLVSFQTCTTNFVL